MVVKVTEKPASENILQECIVVKAADFATHSSNNNKATTYDRSDTYVRDEVLDCKFAVICCTEGTPVSRNILTKPYNYRNSPPSFKSHSAKSS